jgi:endoglucanase
VSVSRKGPAPSRALARIGVVLAAVSLLASAVAVAPTARAAFAPSGLHVSGNQIVDAGAHVLRLIGVNRSGTEYQCIHGFGIFEGPSDAASVQAIADWHANAVRIPLNEDCWLGINGAPAAYSGANYQSAIATYVTLLESRGLVPILELHWSAPGSTQASGQQPMPDFDHSITFWSQVATRFKVDLGVVFDLFNEPFPDGNQDTPAAWQCWRDGGTCPGVPFQAAGMQDLVTAVRATGATNVILLGGVRYANAMAQWLAYKPVDPTGNLAASWHAYNFNACATVACWDAEVAPVLNSVPLIATEIGQDGCGRTFLDLVMPWLDSHGTGYLAWAWDTNFGCFSLITDFAGTPTQPYGGAVHDHLASIAVWTLTPAMPVTRTGATATRLRDGRVLVTGGQGGPSGYLASAELYDPIANTWTAAADMSAPRALHQATLLPDGRVLVAGGTTPFPVSELSSAEIYDPTTDSWSPAGSMPGGARWAFTMTNLASGKILITGGSLYISSAAVYDPASDTWASAGNMSTDRRFHTATLLPNGRVLIVGGFSQSNAGTPAAFPTAAELYDPTTNGWSMTGPITGGRFEHTATILPDGRVMVAGGYGPDPICCEAIASTQIYDPVGGTWTAGPPMTWPRSAFTATTLIDGRILVAGGHVSTAEIFDPTSGAWSATADMLAEQESFATATLLADGRVLVAGGTDHAAGHAIAAAEVFRPPLPTVLPVDANGDGIDDVLQPSGTAAGSFVDTTTPVATSGSIVATDAGVAVRVVDAPIEGVEITVSGTAGGQATFSLCGSTVQLAVGGDVFVTCHSLGLRVVTGSAVVVLNASTTLTVPSGVTADVSTTGSGFSVVNQGGAVTVTTNGVVTTIAPGSVPVVIDTTPPLITFAAHPPSYTVDQTVTITCTASDASGIASSTCPSVVNAPAYSFPLGPTTVSANATDTVGNTASASTSFSVRVTPTSLCALTHQFVQGSAKYQALSVKLRTAVDALVNAACKPLDAITSKLTAKQKAALISAYKNGVQALVSPGWLTQTQATKLRTLADAL